MFKNLKYDLKAGIVVFLVALPLCLGIALAQNVNLIAGLISGIVGGVVITLISGSKLSVSGPAAGLTSIVIVALSDLQTFEAFLMALVLAGIIQVIFGLIRAGAISNYFPSPVINGMLAGIGLFLVIKQIPHLVGYDKDPEGDFEFFQKDGYNSFSELGHMLDFVIPGALIIGVISLAFLILWETKWIKNNRILSNIPGALIVVIIGILINEFFQSSFSSIAAYNDHLVSMPKLNSLADMDNAFTSPDWGVIGQFNVWKVAFTLALVASLESLLSLEAVDKIDPSNHVSPPNRELIAQGIGNTICGLIGGIPVTSVIVRSSANVNAGAKSKGSAIIHGILLLLAILFLAPFLEMIPYASLAAILTVVGYKLAKPSLFVKTYRNGMAHFLPFITTLVVMLLTDLLVGVTVGIVVGVLYIVIKNYKKPFAKPFNIQKGNIEGKAHYNIQLSENISFINKGKMVKTLNKIPEDSTVFIDGKNNIHIDSDVLEVISKYKQSSFTKNIEVILDDIEEVEQINSH